MGQDQRRTKRLSRPGGQPPGASAPALLLAVLAAQALCPHGISADPGATQTITNYRISVPRPCAPVEMTDATPSRDDTTRLETAR